MISNNQRIKWIDIARGIAIISVVGGHSGNPFLSHYIYWFHMPLFFIISGYLHKQPDSFDTFAAKTRKRTCRLLIPYVSFYLLILLIAKFEGSLPLAINIKDITRLLCGGQMLTGFFASFWFITVLYLTQIAFSLLLLNIRNPKAVAAIIALSYLLSYFDSLFSVSGHDIRFLWNADVVLFAIVFYSIGYLLKNNKIAVNPKVLALCSLVACMAVIFDAFGIIDYTLDMKISRYNHFLLDLLIPTSLSILVLRLSRFVEKYSFSKYLVHAGIYSLSIMYLHMPINILMDHICPRNPLVVSVVGIVIPVLISKFIFERHYLTRLLFLGKLPRKINAKTASGQGYGS